MAKTSSNIFWIALLAFAAVLALYGVSSYNKLVAKDENVTNSFNNLQARYQRRFDLIPMLVQVVKGASDFEQQTLEKLALIRSKAGSVQPVSGVVQPSDVSVLQNSQDEFANNFNRILAVVENYPEIKSQKNYLYLQDQIKGTEQRIKVARSDFNEAIRDYNTYVRTFPSSIMAGLFGFKTKDGFKAETGADKAVEIKF